MVFVVLKRKYTPPTHIPAKEHRGPGTQERTAKKLHLPSSNYKNDMSLTIGCWDCQIKTHLATLSAWHPLEEDTFVKALTMISSSYILCLPHGHSLGGQDSELITHLITDVTVDRVFP